VLEDLGRGLDAAPVEAHEAALGAELVGVGPGVTCVPGLEEALVQRFGGVLRHRRNLPIGPALVFNQLVDNDGSNA
jgi:hypothetical protein